MIKENILSFIQNVSLELKEERKKKNIRSKDAAQAINIHNSTYSLLENKPKKNVSLLKFCIMAHSLNVSLSSLLKKVYFKMNDIENREIRDISHGKLNPELLINQTFEEIKSERKHKGVSQRVVAEKIGIQRRYFGQIENGDRVLISLYKLIEISEALELPLYVLVERAEQSLIEKDKDNDIE